MKKSNWKVLFIFVVNFLLTLFFNRANHFLSILTIDAIIWFVLFIPYYFFIKVNDKSQKINYYYFFYLVNLTLLNILFLIFQLSFLKIKLITFIIIGILNFTKNKLINVNKINNYLFLFNIVTFFMLSSSMVPIGQRNSTTDSSVFRYVAVLMDKGKIPYKDVFDHKGLLLYFINYLAIIIHKEIGIWLVELIFLYLSIMIIYKISILFTKKMNLFSTFVIFSYLFETSYADGNTVEVYAICFLLIGLYLFYKDLKFKDMITMNNAFLIGISLGAVLMLRPNMIAIYICMAFYLLIMYLQKKKIKELFLLITSFIFGVVLFIVPNIIYLIVNDALKDFLYQYIVFNFNYSSYDSGNSILETVIFFLKNGKLIMISFIIIIVFFIRRLYDRKKLMLSLFMILLSFMLVVIPKNLYLHYSIVMIPCFIYPIVVFFDYLYVRVCEIVNNVCLVKCIIILLGCLFLFSDFAFLFCNINGKLVSNNDYEIVEKIIKSETKVNDNILIYGNRVNIYLKTNRFTKSKYPYQLPIINVDEKIKKDFQNQIVKELPELLVVYRSDLKSFKQNLEMVLDNYVIIYQDEFFIYKLKDFYS